ncbi:MAG TPA: DUF1634 domain-containing protein [Candidatus Limnocylindrales bacterium]|nr:DUF1634 domain-containing protein [Candidatus Limnocylindrales bacterium]
MTSTKAAPAATAGPAAPGAPPADLERSIARLLTLGTYASVALLVIGVVLMLAGGIGPRSGGPVFDPTTLVPDLLALRPTGFLWLGLIAVLATPAARVVASLVGYIRRGERTMTVVAALILLVIALSVALARGLES